MRKIRAIATTLAVALALLIGVAGGAAAQPTHPNLLVRPNADIGTAFIALNPGDFIHSPDNRFYFLMQTDGNLVLYYQNGRACWASGTNGTNGAYARFVQRGPFESDSLVVYHPQGFALRDYANYNGGTNVSLNNNGQVWIGYSRFVSC
jgi:hypothetical protein